MAAIVERGGQLSLSRGLLVVPRLRYKLTYIIVHV